MGAVEVKIVQTEVLGTHEVFLLRPIDIPRLKQGNNSQLRLRMRFTSRSLFNIDSMENGPVNLTSRLFSATVQAGMRGSGA